MGGNLTLSFPEINKPRFDRKKCIKIEIECVFVADF